jgi:flagellar protein FliT
MALQLLANPEYTVEIGVKKIRALQEEMVAALNLADWEKIRYLDSVCALVVERTQAQDRHEKSLLLAALTELKTIYTKIILDCEKTGESIC